MEDDLWATRETCGTTYHPNSDGDGCPTCEHNDGHVGE